MAAERYLSRRIPDLRVCNNIDKIDKKPVPSIYTSLTLHICICIYLSGMSSTILNFMPVVIKKKTFNCVLLKSKKRIYMYFRLHRFLK